MLAIRNLYSRRVMVAAVVAFGMMLTAPAKASQAHHSTETAQEFIKALADQAIGVLSQADATQDYRLSVFRALLTERFHLRFLAGITLGRYRPRPGASGIPGMTPTEGQYAEYNTLFGNFILQKYSSMLGAYSGQTINVVRAVPRGRRDFLVETKVVNTDQGDIPLTWHVRDFKGTLKVIDIHVANISMVVSQRDEFASVIRREGFEGLLQLLRRQSQDVATTG